MITSLRLVNFKNFVDETLRGGPFTVIVGTNASGKSNIRDAARFLHGIGRGYTLAEIAGGKYGEGGYPEWTGIRGAMDEIVRLGEDGFLLEAEFKSSDDFLRTTFGTETMTYRIGIRREAISGEFWVAHESLFTESICIFYDRCLAT